jgi:uncharacterized membrane protein YphA (DoxX/SURF4 family)
VANFIHNLGLFLLRFVTGSLVSFFAAREMAGRSNIILETLNFFSMAAPDIVKVLVGCMILFLGAMLVIGLWTRFIALVLLLLLGFGAYCWSPQMSQFNFNIEAAYGILFFYLLLVGGGQWAVSRKRNPKGHSVLDSEQSILPNDGRPSIFKEENVDGTSTLLPPVIVDGADEGFDFEEESPNLMDPSDIEDDDEEEDRGSR